MRITVERLRLLLVMGVALLVLVIAGFLGYAHYRAHRFLAGLPAKLGINIRRETNGYTYSQSVGGKTVMTLHASKAIEHNNGKVTLRDVSMTLYGRKENREDHISGSEFEYDQGAGIVKAAGEVHIDLEAPQHEPAPDHPKTEPQEGARVIHIKTSGLIYLQKLGVATTDQELDFQFSGITGHSRGAEYNANTGVVILQSQVKANGMEHGKPVVLTATHAEMDRDSQQALLTQAEYVSAAEKARGDHAIVHLRPDGSPQRIEANGHVTLSGSKMGEVMAPRADVLLDDAGRAQNAHLFEGVSFQQTDPLREGTGSARDLVVRFDRNGQPRHAVLTGSAKVHQRVRPTPTAPWSTRDASAGTITLALSTSGRGAHPVPQAIDAETAAHVTLTSEMGTTELAADQLHGIFTGSGKALQLSEIHGTGHTLLHRLGADHAEQTSTGDTVLIHLRPSSHVLTASASAHEAPEEVADATQTGHVILTSRAAYRTGQTPPPLTHATGDLAVYDGQADHLTLTGHAAVHDEESSVSADRIVLEHQSGDAAAQGNVKATYIQPHATEATHILAVLADLQHTAGRAFFYGAAGAPARMWQGASQVEAPVIELEQQQHRLTARGASDAETAPVHAVLVNARSPQQESKPSASGKSPLSSSVMRVACWLMVYQDAERRVDFSGGVTIMNADGTIRAHQATAYLQPAPDGAAGSSNKNAKTTGNILFGGGVERVIATGRIEMEQPGRHATGEQLVYTAGEGLFVLTGTAAAPPRLVDEVQGTVTGSSLRFRTGDDSVMITGTDGSQRAHTVTRVKQK